MPAEFKNLYNQFKDFFPECLTKNYPQIYSDFYPYHDCYLHNGLVKYWVDNQEDDVNMSKPAYKQFKNLDKQHYRILSLRHQGQWTMIEINNSKKSSGIKENGSFMDQCNYREKTNK